ncbi:diacylglycerol O-acyltransferase 1 [Apophysomyces ossiformis]|uniref:Diacylglycerol O-acyltransferase n=1 Tax=Apophysomyces ossiformis TaxID=679940 RepID=A0A8H7BMW4_9FUNG|nr:diacylglycerol O-acyltransferase 1 [Apophysomyces ossiformis]
MSVDLPKLRHLKTKSKQSDPLIAPLNVPLTRRLQTLAVIVWGIEPSFLVTVFLLLCTIPALWPILIVYVVWVAFDNAPENGGRRVQWVREWRLWRYFAGYFPAEIIKEGDLDANKNYIFACHPHGIIAVSSILTFATEALGFSKLYPGIVPSLLTVANNFRLPFHRDYLLAMGMCNVSRESCKTILRSGPGRSIAIVVGGATESLNSRPGSMNLVLRKRFGFVKVAVETGASLVPVLAFGEHQLFDQLRNDAGTWVHRFQKRTQQIFGWTMPFFHGRGVFNYDIGIMPYRRPLHVVIGEAIDPPIDAAERNKEEVIQDLHARYVESLLALYDKYKDVYDTDRIKELSFVD